MAVRADDRQAFDRREQRPRDAAGGRVDGPSVAAAIRAMGTKHQSAYAYDGTTSYGPTRQSGIASAYPFKYDGGCSCFKYSGGRIPVP